MIFSSYLRIMSLRYFKSVNGLINAENNKKICNFLSLNFTKYAPGRLCSPENYRPPEYFFFFFMSGGIYGKVQLSNLWTFGLLSFNIFTGHHYYKNINRINKAHTIMITQMLTDLDGMQRSFAIFTKISIL